MVNWTCISLVNYSDCRSTFDLRLAGAALEIVTQIKNNTNAIWELETTNKVAVDIQNEAEAIEAHATLVAEALE